MSTEMTILQAAEELNVSKQAIFTAVKFKRLPAERRIIPPFGPVFFIKRGDFLEWAEGSEARRLAHKKDDKPRSKRRALPRM